MNKVQVIVTHGSIVNNEFKATDAREGYPDPYAIGPFNVNRGLSNERWGTPGAKLIPPAFRLANDLVRAHLQFSNDGGMSWATVATAYDYIE